MKNKLCKCGKIKLDDFYCGYCREKHNKRNNKVVLQTANRKLNNLCRCNKPLVLGKSRCYGCAEREKNRKNKQRQERKVLGVCTRCGNEIVTHKSCEVCRTKANILYNTNKKLNEELRAKRILSNAKVKYKSDIKFTYDITLDFILEAFTKNCSYCEQGEDIGLDRIDNEKGYLKTNVVPCCLTCNLIRKDLPYPAWMILSNNMKEIKENKLLEGWSPFKKKRKTF